MDESVLEDNNVSVVNLFNLCLLFLVDFNGFLMNSCFKFVIFFYFFFLEWFVYFFYYFLLNKFICYVFYNEKLIDFCYWKR